VLRSRLAQISQNMRAVSRESPVDLEQLRDQLIERARPVRALAANLKLQEFLREEHKKEQAGDRG
jgi:hypothetical protein